MQSVLDLATFLGVELADHTVDWAIVERELGITLPDDYKFFVEHFPHGTLLNFITVLRPGAPTKHTDLIQKGLVIRDVLCEIAAMGDTECPYPIFPAPTGLMPWGISDNGNFLLWRTQAPQWSMVIGSARDSKWAEYPLCMTEFLLKVAHGEIVCPVFPDDLLEENPWFEPYPLPPA